MARECPRCGRREIDVQITSTGAELMCSPWTSPACWVIVAVVLPDNRIVRADGSPVLRAACSEEPTVSGAAINLGVHLVSEECITAGCGVLFAVPAAYQRRRRNDHATFYCPNGHGQHYNGKSDEQKAREEAERLREQLALEQRRLASREEELRDERLAHRATKGHLTRQRRRATHGVCPAPGCKRTFANVAAHVERQHPDYQAAVG